MTSTYFPAAQGEALSLRQWSELEMGWEETPRGWKKLVDMLEGRKVGENVPPQFWVYYGVLQKVVLLVE